MIFWILIIIIIILLAFIYKLYISKKQILEIAQIFLKTISEKEDYLLLNTKELLCLPNEYKKQTEKLMSEINENTSTINDIASEIPNAKILLLLYPSNKNQKKYVIGMLNILLLYESKSTLKRVLEKVNSQIVPNNSIYISSVIIDKNYRGQGFGKKLFEILFQIIKKDLILEVKKNNDTAINLYHKMNFNIIGQDKNIYLMKKNI